MVKYNLLKGIANNLKKSFLSSANIFLRELGFDSNRELEIDFLNETIKPNEFDTEEARQTIQKYKEWLKNELDKNNIPLTDLTEIKLNLHFEKYHSKSTKIDNVKLPEINLSLTNTYTDKGINYNCKVKISVKDKEYESY